MSKPGRLTPAIKAIVVLTVAAAMLVAMVRLLSERGRGVGYFAEVKKNANRSPRCAERGVEKLSACRRLNRTDAGAEYGRLFEGHAEFVCDGTTVKIIQGDRGAYTNIRVGSGGLTREKLDLARIERVVDGVRRGVEIECGLESNVWKLELREP